MFKKFIAILAFAAASILSSQQPQTQNAPIFATNAKYVNGVAPGYWPTQQSITNGSGGTIPAATGLNINVGPGTANCGSGSITIYTGGTFALTASATNRIYLNTASSCVPAIKTSAFGSTDIPLAVVVTSGSAITSISDVRTQFTASAASGLTSLNGLTGPALNLVSSDSSVMITPSGPTIDLKATSSGGGGTIPSNAKFVFACTSGCDDDNGSGSTPLSPHINLSSYSQIGSVVSFVNTGTNNLAVGDWVSMRFVTGWAPNLPSGLALGTGHTLFQVLSSGLSATTFQVNVGSLPAQTTCPSSCGIAESAMSFNPFIMAKNPSFPANALANTVVLIPAPVTVPGMASTYATNYHAYSPAVTGNPAYLIIMDHDNDDATCIDPASVVQPAYQSLFSQAHTDNYTVVVGTGVSYNFNQVTGCRTAYLKYNANRKWLISQGPSAAGRVTGQFWDILVDTSTATLDGTNPLMPTWLSDGQKAVASANASAIASGGTPVYWNPYFWGAFQGGNNQGMRWAPYNDDAGQAFTITDNAGDDIFKVSSGGEIYANTVFHVNFPGICPNFTSFCVGAGFFTDTSGNTTAKGNINFFGIKAPSVTSCLQIDTSGNVTNTGAACGGSSVAWGSITGTLSSQTDLQNALNLKAPLASPALTGIPTAPTASGGTSTTQLATTAFVQAAIAAAGTGSGIVTYSGPAVSFTGTLYFPIGGGGLSSTTEANVDIDSPAATTIQNMTVQMSAAPGVGNSITYTWRKNGSSTALTCTISGASATSCSDTTHSFTTVALDLLSIQTVTTGTVAGTPTVVMAAQVGVASSTSAGVSAITPGTNVTCTPLVSGTCTGAVTVNASGGGSGAMTNITGSVTNSGCDSVTSGKCIISGSTTSTVTFSSIPSTGNSILIVIHGRADTSAEATSINGVFNSSTSGYNGAFYGNGAAADSAHPSSASSALMGVIAAASAPSGQASQIKIWIDDYANTTFHRTWTAEAIDGLGPGDPTNLRYMLGGEWTDTTTAINSIALTVGGSGHYVAGSSISIYLIQ